MATFVSMRSTRPVGAPRERAFTMMMRLSRAPAPSPYARDQPEQPVESNAKARAGDSDLRIEQGGAKRSSSSSSSHVVSRFIAPPLLIYLISSSEIPP